MTETTVAEQQAKVTIDGQEYALNDLSDQAKGQLISIQGSDAQLQQLTNQLALAQTARQAYARLLGENLPEKKAAANKKKGVIAIDGDNYNLDDLSEAAQQQIANLQFADQEITRLNNQKAITQTARQAYARALSEVLPKQAG